VWDGKKFNFKALLIDRQRCDMQKRIRRPFTKKKRRVNVTRLFWTHYFTDNLECNLESLPDSPCIVRGLATGYDLIVVPCKEITALNIVDEVLV